MVKEARLRALHRYFLAAARMRQDFWDFYRQHHESAGRDSELYVDFFTYLSLWYSTLWVALDGWKQLGVEDAALGEALEDPRTLLLRDFRNATLHFDSTFPAKRHMALIDASQAAGWVFYVHAKLERAILAEFKKAGLDVGYHYH